MLGPETSHRLPVTPVRRTNVFVGQHRLGPPTLLDRPTCDKRGKVAHWGILKRSSFPVFFFFSYHAFFPPDTTCVEATLTINGTETHVFFHTLQERASVNGT